MSHFTIALLSFVHITTYVDHGTVFFLCIRNDISSLYHIFAARKREQVRRNALHPMLVAIKVLHQKPYVRCGQL